MAKNLTRKGIAFGALVALGASAFAGTPAFAVEPVSLDPYAGTSYSTILGESFKLTSLFTDAAQVGSESINYMVTDASGVLDLTASGTNGTLGLSTTRVIGTAGNATVSALNTDKQVDYLAGNTMAPASDYLTVKATAAGSVTVQAYLDYNGNHKIDAGEAASLVRTVTFVAPANVTATTTVTGPIAGDTSVVAKVSFNGLNNEQIDQAHVGAYFTKGDATTYTRSASITAWAVATNVLTVTAANNFVTGDSVTISGIAAINGTYTLTGATGTTFTAAKTTADASATVAGTAVAAERIADVKKTNVAWSATDSFKYTATVTALVAAEAVKVQPLYLASGAPAKTDTIGSAVTATVSATSVATIKGAVVASNVSAAGATANVAPDAAFNVSLLAEDATTPTALAVAGKTVTYTVTIGGTPGADWNAQTTAAAYAASVSTTKATISVNGVTYTNQADLATANTATFSGVTDANGKIAVAIALKNLAAGTTVTVTPAVEHAVATNAVATVQSLTYSATPSNSYSTIVAGGSSSATVSVVDQFGKALADGYNAIATITSTGRTTAATGTVTAAVVGGKATLNFVDNGVGTGTNTYAISIAKADATTQTYVVPAGTPAATATVYIKNAADLVAGKIALGSPAVVDATVTTKYTTSGGTIDTNTFGNYATADVLGTKPGVVDGTNSKHITGTVSSASTATYVGVAIAGAKVTVAAAGAQFKDTVTGLYATDSITVNANNSGVFDVLVWSHKSGDVTYTVTSGAAVVTNIVTYAAPAANTGAAVKITAPATALPGTTIAVTATVVDQFGNAIDTISASNALGDPLFSLAIAGIGSGSTQSTYNATLASATAFTSGTVTKYVVLGASDTGVLTITATYDADGTTTTKAAVVATGSVKVGLPSAAKTALAVGADQAQVGAAVDVIATATDAAGKAAAGVVVTFDNVGQGYLSATSATTDANGVAKVKLVGNVAGRNTLTATANGATAANAGVSFGAADANITVKGKRVTVTYEYAGLAKVVVSVNGVRKPAVYPADDNEGTFSFNLKAGTNKIAVSIAGKTVDSKTVKIKK